MLSCCLTADSTCPCSPQIHRLRGLYVVHPRQQQRRALAPAAALSTATTAVGDAALRAAFASLALRSHLAGLRLRTAAWCNACSVRSEQQVHRGSCARTLVNSAALQFAQEEAAGSLQMPASMLLRANRHLTSTLF